MKYLNLSYLFIFLCSCSTIRIKKDKDITNTTDIGISWNYSGKFNDYYKPKLDSAMLSEMTIFNHEQRVFKVHRKKDGERDFLTYKFVKGRLVSKKEQFWGYTSVAAGNIALPVTLAIAGVGFYGISYIPQNKIFANVRSSESLGDSGSRDKKIKVRSLSLFSGLSKKRDKTIHNFAFKFRQSLLGIETQLKQHSSANKPEPVFSNTAVGH
jgi:hypothetical protein